MEIDLVRPDDLLNVRIEAANLRLDTYDLQAPALVVDDPQQPAYLTFIFPPQTIAERAYFEAAIVNPPVDPIIPSRSHRRPTLTGPIPGLGIIFPLYRQAES